MGNDNQDKMQHGKNGIESVGQMLTSLMNADYLVNVVHPYRIGDPDYDEEQFYFQYLIEFHDSKQWILHHTTSIKDRIAEQQWNSEHIKRLNSNVEKAYVIVPDDMDERPQKTAESYNKKIQEKRIYSALDGVIQFNDAYHLIEHRASETMGFGQSKAKLGLHFEQKLVDCLNNTQNLNKWKGKSQLEVGYLYPLYKDILETFDIQQNNITSINATSNIPRLSTGGLPKTDVVVTIATPEGNFDYTISCKRSTAKSVSVHEYTADAFCNVLNPKDNELRSLLVEFQNAGGVMSMDPSDAHRLTEKLSDYKYDLCKWVIAGIGGEGNPDLQWAKYIVIVDDNTNDYRIRTVEEYISEIMNNVNGQLGTPFQWTYPSGGKGKRIQLKCKLI